MIEIPTITEIRDNILADIETATGKSAPLLPRSVWRVLATALAGALHLLYRFGRWAYRQIFTVSQDESSLLLRAQEYGIVRTPATKFIGEITITGSGATIPAGTLWQKDGNVYQSTESVIFSTSDTVEIESLETGDDVNLSLSDELELVTPQSGVDAEATVSTVTQAAEDAETVEDFRSRILFRQQNQPQGGAIADFVLWATEVSGIAEAFVKRPEPGFVTIYPITDDADPADRIPSGTKITEVQTYVSDTTRRPLNAQVTVTAPTEVEFDVDIADLDPNDADTKAAIISAIESYMYARRPVQYTDQATDNSTISEAQIARIAVDAGAEVATVDLKNASGTSITSYELSVGELAKLGSVSWV